MHRDFATKNKWLVVDGSDGDLRPVSGGAMQVFLKFGSLSGVPPYRYCKCLFLWVKSHARRVYMYGHVVFGDLANRQLGLRI